MLISSKRITLALLTTLTIMPAFALSLTAMAATIPATKGAKVISPSGAVPAPASATLDQPFSMWMDKYLFPAPHGGIRALDTRTPIYQSQGGVTLSGDQAYAMLFAATTHATFTFAHLWQYAQTQLDTHGLMHVEIAANGKVMMKESFSRADLDMALALLMAGRNWHDATYTKAGIYMANTVYKLEVNKQHEVLNADGGTQCVPFSPLYLPTGAFTYLAQASDNQGWIAVGKANGESTTTIQKQVAAMAKQYPSNTGMNDTLGLWVKMLQN